MLNTLLQGVGAFLILGGVLNVGYDLLSRGIPARPEYTQSVIGYWIYLASYFFSLPLIGWGLMWLGRRRGG